MAIRDKRTAQPLSDDPSNKTAFMFPISPKEQLTVCGGQVKRTASVSKSQGRSRLPDSVCVCVCVIKHATAAAVRHQRNTGNAGCCRLHSCRISGRCQHMCLESNFLSPDVEKTRQDILKCTKAR